MFIQTEDLEEQNSVFEHDFLQPTYENICEYTNENMQLEG